MWRFNAENHNNECNTGSCHGYSPDDEGRIPVDNELELAVNIAMPLPGAGKAKAGVELVERFSDFNKARNAALSWLKGRGFKAEAQTMGRIGDAAGKPIGMKTANGKTGFRVEYNPDPSATHTGAHINVWSGGEKSTFMFEGSQSTVNKIWKQFEK